jgi:hypothetical protein
VPEKNNAGKIDVYSAIDNVNVVFYGDYLFHKFNSNSPLFNTKWNKSLTIANKCRILYSAHTTIKPYCSVVGISYADSNKDTLTELLFQQIKSSGFSENLKLENLLIGKEYFSVFDYDFYYIKQSRFVHYTEYLSQQGNRVYRIAFSTLDSNLEWFKNESTGILESMEYR